MRSNSRFIYIGQRVVIDFDRTQVVLSLLIVDKSQNLPPQGTNQAYTAEGMEIDPEPETFKLTGTK